MANAKILHRDLVAGSVLQASSFQPLLAPSNLEAAANVDLGIPWRTLEGVSSAWILADLGAATAVAGTALLAFMGSSAATFRIRLSTADATGAAGDAYDSGILSSVFDPEYRHLIHFWDEASGRYLRLDITDPGAPHLEAAGLLAGPVWQPQTNYERNFSLSWEDQDQVVRTRGGVEWVSETAAWRRWRGRFPAVTQAEARAELYQIGTRVKRRLPILLCWDPAGGNLGRDSIVGRLQLPPAAPDAFHQHTRWDVDIAELV